MKSKNCTQCFIEKHINSSYKRYSECKKCINKRGIKRYYDNKDKISIQQKRYCEKKEINYYRNKTTTEIKETQTLENDIDPMLN